ncbi:polysaccharide deacetylase family protein [Paenibacillus alvei A6-6i-x]|nr:polysaccharide deacetylase family protein [Paenibacillus alvei A6-6i-x]
MNVVKNVKNKKNMITFTFDDGPNPQYTPLLLRILNENNVKSTFFVLGKCVYAFPDLLREIYKEGHEIGNHTYTHYDLTEQSDDLIKKEIKDAEDLIYSITGETPKLLRSPYGTYNKKVLSIINEMGYKFCHWSDQLGIEDWTLPGVDSLVDSLLRVEQGDIILLHDAGGNRDQTMQAIEIALPLLVKKYNVVPLGEMLLHECE